MQLAGPIFGALIGITQRHHKAFLCIPAPRVMGRVDIWDVPVPSNSHEKPIDAGFPRGFAEKFEVGALLGSGGFGSVRVAKDRLSGQELAVKAIPKRLDVPNISPTKQAQHLENVKREVEVRCWNLLLGAPLCPHRAPSLNT